MKPTIFLMEEHMTNGTQTILIVDSNAETRARLARELVATGRRVLEAEDGIRGFELVRKGGVHLLIAELFLKTAESECLFQAVRANRVHGTRMLAHTTHRTTKGREWAMQWGARAFLVQPVKTERLRYVVRRLLAAPAAAVTGAVRMSRRDTLGDALTEIEGGQLSGAASIVVGGAWWTTLTVADRNAYRRRARRSGISLRSDAMMSPHFVEVRDSVQQKLSA